MVTNYEVVPVRRTHVGLAIALLVCLVGALGFYRGWFSVSERREAVTHRVDVKLKIDPDKMKDDVRRATDSTEQKAAELSQKIKQDAPQIKGTTTTK
jgi:hypothetical protein